MNLKQGKRLVQIARQAIESVFEDREFKVEDLREKRGVFVSLHTGDGKLRGCIGFAEPFFSLGRALVESAKEAAFSDPRFPTLKKEELDNVIIEVSVLTKPELIKADEDYIESIKIGEDGIIVEYFGRKGLLLPQVPVSLGWTAEQFLKGACLKAGIPPNTLEDKNCKVYKFQAEIFKESTPGGKVKRV